MEIVKDEGFLYLKSKMGDGYWVAPAETQRLDFLSTAHLYNEAPSVLARHQAHLYDGMDRLIHNAVSHGEFVKELYCELYPALNFLKDMPDYDKREYGVGNI